MKFSTTVLLLINLLAVVVENGFFFATATAAAAVNATRIKQDKIVGYGNDADAYVSMMSVNISRNLQQAKLMMGGASGNNNERRRAKIIGKEVEQQVQVTLVNLNDKTVTRKEQAFIKKSFIAATEIAYKDQELSLTTVELLKKKYYPEEKQEGGGGGRRQLWDYRLNHFNIQFLIHGRCTTCFDDRRRLGQANASKKMKKRAERLLCKKLTKSRFDVFGDLAECSIDFA